MRLEVLACGFAATMGAASAHSQAAAPAVAPAPDPKPCCMVLAGTPVEIEISESVTSRTAHSGDSYELRLARDLVMDGVVVVAAGAPGRGEVIDAGAGGIGGRPGKLILAARSIKAGDTRLPLRSFHMSGSGRDDSKAVGLVIATVGVVGFALRGGDIAFPSGTRASAKVAADTFILSSSQPHPSAADGPPPAKEKTP